MGHFDKRIETNTIRCMFLDAKNSILDLLFPALCAGCRAEGSFLCQNCAARLQWIPPCCIVCGAWSPHGIKTFPGRTCLSCRAKSNIYGFFSPFSFSCEPIRTLIHAFKYRRTRAIVPTLAAILEQYMQKFGINLSVHAIIIPIPLHTSRERVRGFNQSALLAHHLAKKIGIPVKEKILIRTKKTVPQIELSGEERKENMKNAFTVSPYDATALRKKTILLLDDVKTTGATLEEAAQMLKGAGAKRVWAVTIAH